MKKVEMYQTIDGQVHGSFEAAKQHSASEYESNLHFLAARAIASTKGMTDLEELHRALVDMFEKNLAVFANTARWKRDSTIMEEGEQIGFAVVNKVEVVQPVLKDEDW